MASFTKRNGRWRARVRRSGLPSLTKSFPTKTLALKWSRKVECDPEKFLTEQLPEDHQLRTVGDLLRKYETEVTPQKKGETRKNTGSEFFRGPSFQMCH